MSRGSMMRKGGGGCNCIIMKGGHTQHEGGDTPI